MPLLFSKETEIAHEIQFSVCFDTNFWTSPFCFPSLLSSGGFCLAARPIRARRYFEVELAALTVHLLACTCSGWTAVCQYVCTLRERNPYLWRVGSFPSRLLSIYRIQVIIWINILFCPLNGWKNPDATLLMDSWGTPGAAHSPLCTGDNFINLWTRRFGAAVNLAVVTVKSLQSLFRAVYVFMWHLGWDVGGLFQHGGSSMLIPAVWFGQDLKENWQMKAEETCRCVIL